MVAVSVQQGVVNGAVSSMLFVALLQGINTTVYIGTLYITLTRKSSPNYLVLAAITGLYVVNILETALIWRDVMHILGMSNNPNPLASEFLFLVYGSRHDWPQLLYRICSFLLTVIADGLIIWRCYKVWGDSFRAILAPLTLVLIETVLYVVSITVFCMRQFSASYYLQSESNYVLALQNAAQLVAMFTTMVATLLIFYRIHSVSHRSFVNGGRKRYRHILALIVESSALHVVGMLLFVIPNFVPMTDANILPLNMVLNYGGSIFPFTAGMAPTLMVARVALASDGTVRNETTVQISAMKFGSHGTNIISSQCESERRLSGDLEKGT